MIKNTRIQKQFSKNANQYNQYNIIQQIVSKALVREIQSNPKKILELGSGSGQVFKNINFKYDYYKAIDFSQSMCDIHPTAKNLEIICTDFDSDYFYNNLKDNKYDIVLSSSALQWSSNLHKIISFLSTITKEISMVLFTSNTFKTIFKLTNTVSPILTTNTIKEVFSNNFNCNFEILNYKIEFDSKKELFKYIKNSGVSGQTNNLSFKNAKYLFKNYNLNYLEFEVIFIKGFKC